MHRQDSSNARSEREEVLKHPLSDATNRQVLKASRQFGSSPSGSPNVMKSFADVVKNESLSPWSASYNEKFPPLPAKASEVPSKAKATSVNFKFGSSGGLLKHALSNYSKSKPPPVRPPVPPYQFSKSDRRNDDMSSDSSETAESSQEVFILVSKAKLNKTSSDDGSSVKLAGKTRESPTTVRAVQNSIQSSKAPVSRKRTSAHWEEAKSDRHNENLSSSLESDESSPEDPTPIKMRKSTRVSTVKSYNERSNKGDGDLSSDDSDEWKPELSPKRFTPVYTAYEASNKRPPLMTSTKLSPVAVRVKTPKQPASSEEALNEFSCQKQVDEEDSKPLPKECVNINLPFGPASTISELHKNFCMVDEQMLNCFDRVKLLQYFLAHTMSDFELTNGEYRCKLNHSSHNDARKCNTSSGLFFFLARVSLRHYGLALNLCFLCGGPFTIHAKQPLENLHRHYNWDKCRNKNQNIKVIVTREHIADLKTNVGINRLESKTAAKMMKNNKETSKVERQIIVRELSTLANATVNNPPSDEASRYAKSCLDWMSSNGIIASNQIYTDWMTKLRTL